MGSQEQTARAYHAALGVDHAKFTYSPYRDFFNQQRLNSILGTSGARLHPTRGVYMREASYDHQFFSEVAEHDRMSIHASDVVLDVGGNVGLFSLYAADRGAASITCVEPDHHNVELCKLNFAQKAQSWRIITCAAAAVRSDYDQTTIPLYVNPGAGKGMHSITPKRGRHTENVWAVRIADLISAVNPTVLKVDIEGGEYEMIQDICAIASHNSRVRAISLELHLTRLQWRRVLAPQLVNHLMQYFHTAVDPRAHIAGKAWSTRFVGVR